MNWRNRQICSTDLPHLWTIGQTYRPHTWTAFNHTSGTVAGSTLYYPIPHNKYTCNQWAFHSQYYPWRTLCTLSSSLQRNPFPTSSSFLPQHLIPYKQIGIPLFPHHNKPIRRCQRLLFACLFHTMQQSELNQNYHQSLECNLSSTTTITSLNNKHTFNQLVERFEGSYWAFSVKVFSINPSQPWAMDSFKNDWICSVSVAYGIDFNRVVFHTCIWVAYINRPSFSGIVLLKISCLSFNVFWIKHYSL